MQPTLKTAKAARQVQDQAEALLSAARTAAREADEAADPAAAAAKRRLAWELAERARALSDTVLKIIDK